MPIAFLVTAARGAGLPATVANSLKQAGIPESATGWFARELRSARPLLARNDDRPFVTGSVMKLLTSYAALDLLGPAYVWQTEVWLDGQVVNGVLDGDLVLRGGGDPNLLHEDLWTLVREVRARGIRRIGGRLVVDRGRFGPNPVGPAAFDGAALRPYNVLPDPMLVNFKSVRLGFVLQGEKLRVTMTPTLADVRILDQPVLTDGNCHDWQALTGIQVNDVGARVEIRFDGSYPLACGERDWYLSVLERNAYIGALFRGLWREAGGDLVGAVVDGAASPAAHLLYTHRSRPLSVVLRDMNKYSNNATARQLFLSIAAERAPLPATLEKARAVGIQWLAGKRFQRDDFELDNGSGLSRIERARPRALGRLLRDAFYGPSMPELMASLPIVAVDGTTRNRLRDSGVAGRAHVKTGYLDGVRALAGYVLDGKGRWWVVVSLINHPRAAHGQAAQDAFLEWVVSQGR